MRRVSRLLAFSLVGLAACAPPPGANPASAPLASGIDLTAADSAVRVQDDLFRHVNGTWLTKTEIPGDRSSWGSFDRLVEKSQNDLRAIAEDAAKAENKTPGSEAQKIGDFYDSFMNEAKVDELGLEPIKAELAAIDAIKTKEDLARHFARFFKLNLISPVDRVRRRRRRGTWSRHPLPVSGRPRPPRP